MPFSYADFKKRKSEIPPQPPPAPPLTKKWAVEGMLSQSSGNNKPKFNLAEQPSGDVKMDPTELFRNITHIQCSAEGSGGVTFITTRAQGTVVIKGGSSIAQELFGALVAERCGSRVAHMTVYSKADHADVYNQLSPHLDNDIRGHRLLSNYILGIMEFVSGKMMFDLTRDQAATFFNVRNLRQLGNLLLLDVLINNADRIPMSLWNNEGNAGNVMLCAIGPVGIDNRASTIGSTFPRAKKYETKVRMLAQDIVTNEHNASAFHKITQFIETYTQHRLDEYDRRALYQGFIRGIRLMRHNFPNEQSVDALRDEIMTPLIKTDSPHHIWADAVKSCHTDFVWRNIAVLAPLGDLDTIDLMPRIPRVSHELGHSVEILLFQNSWFQVSELHALQAELEATSGIRILVLMTTQETFDMEVQDKLLADLAREHIVHIIARCSIIDGKTTTQQITTLYNDAGAVMRKNNETSGQPYNVFYTKYGRVGIVDGSINTVAPVLESKPFFVVHFPSEQPVSSEHGADFVTSAWSTAMDSTSHRFQNLSSVHNFIFVRADASFPHGIGSSLVVHPSGTHFAPHRFDHILRLQLPQVNIDSFYQAMREPDFLRSESWDNTGSTYHTQALRSFIFASCETGALMTTPVSELPSADNFTCGAMYNNTIAVGLKRGVVELWNVRKMRLFEATITIPNPLQLAWEETVIHSPPVQSSSSSIITNQMVIDTSVDVKAAVKNTNNMRRLYILSENGSVYRVEQSVSSKRQKSPRLHTPKTVIELDTMIVYPPPLEQSDMYDAVKSMQCTPIGLLLQLKHKLELRATSNGAISTVYTAPTGFTLTALLSLNASSDRCLFAVDNNTTLTRSWYLVSCAKEEVSCVALEFMEDATEDDEKSAISLVKGLVHAKLAVLPGNRLLLVCGAADGCLHLGFLSCVNRDQWRCTIRLRLKGHTTTIQQLLKVAPAQSVASDVAPGLEELFFISTSQNGETILWRVDLFHHDAAFEVLNPSDVNSTCTMHICLVHTFLYAHNERVNSCVTLCADEQRRCLIIVDEIGCTTIRFNRNRGFVGLPLLLKKRV